VTAGWLPGSAHRSHRWQVPLAMQVPVYQLCGLRAGSREDTGPRHGPLDKSRPRSMKLLVLLAVSSAAFVQRSLRYSSRLRLQPTSLGILSCTEQSGIGRLR